MTQLRGHWFPILGRSLQWHGLLDLVEKRLPASTRQLFSQADPAGWYEEQHAVLVYEAVAAARDMLSVRNVGRYAARLAMQTTWFAVLEPVVRFHSRTPAKAFEELPRLWSTTRRDAGEVRCIDSGSRHAVTELRGFRHSSSGAWGEAWLGHHEALLRHLRFAGRAELEPSSAQSYLLRVRTTWAGALSGVPTSGRASP
jgi:hypothetical protein